MPVSASKIVLSASRTSASAFTSSPFQSARTPDRLLKRVRPRHPDEHVLELPVGVEVEEVAIVHVVLGAVLQLAEVALLRRNLAGRLLDVDVPDLVPDGRRRDEEGREDTPYLVRAPD